MMAKDKVLYSGFRGDWPALPADFKAPLAAAQRAAAAASAPAKVKEVSAVKTEQQKLF